MLVMEATARAHSNIALIKYWGKRNEALVLPYNSSLSITLNELYSDTTVRFDASLKSDVFMLNGQPATEREQGRVSEFLNHVRQLGNVSCHAAVNSQNQVLTAQGMASSASGFAALACAATAALGLQMNAQSLSRLARLGSGSACRSIYGGFVEWTKGVRSDGLDSHATPIACEDHWDLRILFTITSTSEKQVSSREGMRRTSNTSAFYGEWLATVDRDLKEAKHSVIHREFNRLGQVAEANALKMHATMLTANPPFWYWNETTIRVMNQIQSLRDTGIPAYFTMDAGSNVAVLCEPESVQAVRTHLETIPGVQKVVECRPGPKPTLLKGATKV